MGAWAILAPLLAGSAAALVVASLASSRSSSASVAALQGSRHLASPHERYRGLRERLGRGPVAARLGAREVVRARLDRAGNPMSVEAFRGTQLVSAICGAVVGSVLGAPSPRVLFLGPVGIVLGLRVPRLWLTRRGGARVKQVGTHVPDLVELLVATTQAGLGPMVALVRSADLLRGPLGEEIRLAVRRVELGVPWRDAMREAADRTDVPSLRRLVAALVRSQRLGTSLAGTMRAVADDLRAERRAHAEELARRAPIKMLFPLVFLILPAFLLLTVGPVVLSTLRSLH